jgi:hypothetical protein
MPEQNVESCQVSGLPEGVCSVRYGRPNNHQEFFFLSGELTTLQYQEVSNEWPQLIVKPAEGYEFRRNNELGCFDIVRLYEHQKDLLIRVRIKDSLAEKRTREIAKRWFDITELEEVVDPEHIDPQPTPV